MHIRMHVHTCRDSLFIHSLTHMVGMNDMLCFSKTKTKTTKTKKKKKTKNNCSLKSIP